MEKNLYTIQNEFLRLRVNARGAEVASVVNLATGAEMLWQGDPEVWGRQAPILFPYTGKLTGDKMIADGREYAGGQHGFARDLDHLPVFQSAEKLVFELRTSAETLRFWPYDFVLRSTFWLEGQSVHHMLTVENPGQVPFCFGIGYHPGFVLPFDENHTTQDYELRFDGMESPLCVSALPNGLLNGQSYYLARNVDAIPLTDTLFDNDSHCMVNLKSKTLALVEKDTGRSVTCGIEGYPYVLIWSKNSKPLHFLCMEPWHSLPGEENGPQEWDQRPAAARLAPGESFSTDLKTTFAR